MPEIRPFAGILYDPRAVALAQVVAPPYDVIGPELRAELYDRSPYNIIRLILGRESDPYAAAGEAFAAWLRVGVLRQEREPALYLLAQRFRDLHGHIRNRTGFIGACRLEDFSSGSVLPHERTLSKPKEDRLRLFNATGAMFSQIFSLYSDEKGQLDRLYAGVAGAEPLMEVEFDGVASTVHRITDPSLQRTVAEFMRNRPVLIADGHHRYETALAYRDAHTRQGASGEEAWNFVPMFFTNIHTSDLVIYPTHRLLHDLPDFDGGTFVEDLRKTFDVRTVHGDGELLAALASARPHAFGLVLPDHPHPYLLKARGDIAAQRAGDRDGILWRLDVTVLHELVFKTLLGMSDETQLQKRFLEYDHDAEHAVAAARGRKVQAALILNPTPIEDVRAVASAGLVMPQKSTHFYPKLLSGVLAYSFTGRVTA